MGDSLYWLLNLAIFGPAVAYAVLIIVSIFKGDIEAAELKNAGLVILWFFGGAVFSFVLCRLMSAHGDRADGVAFLIYVIISILIYYLRKKK